MNVDGISDRMVKEFQESLVWRRILEDAEEKKAKIKDELIEVDLKHNVEDAILNQGRYEGINYVLGAPQDFIDEIKMKALEARGHKTDKEE